MTTGRTQPDTDRNALEFITGKGSLEREQAFTRSEPHSRACMHPRPGLAYRRPPKRQ